MKRHSLLLLPLIAAVYSVSVFGQGATQVLVVPDCLVPFSLQGTTIAAEFPINANQGFDNRTAGCDTWTLQYQSVGFSAVTLTFKSSLGAVTPTGYTTYTGTTVFASTGFGGASTSGTNCCIATYTNLATGVVVATPWVQVDVSSTTGTGTVWGVLYGYKTGQTGGTGGGGGGGGGSGCPNPCPVEGVDAAGAAPTVPPVPGAGVYNSSPPSPSTGQLEPLQLDAASNLRVNVEAQIPPLGLGTFATGQTAVTGTAGNLGTATAKSVCVHALIGNTINVYAGPSGVTTSTGMEIPPGQGWCWNLSNTNLLYVVASTTGASVSWSLTN